MSNGRARTCVTSLLGERPESQSEIKRLRNHRDPSQRKHEWRAFPEGGGKYNKAASVDCGETLLPDG